jgi:predicted dehydrogenase
MDRRDFLKYTTLSAGIAGAAVHARAQHTPQGANDRIIVGFMGCGGRGQFLMDEFAARDDVEIRWLADPDSRRTASAAKRLEQKTGKQPKITANFRHLLDDPEVTAIVGALPDHWHALATILACQAGKDMYIEKPTSHSIWESQKMIEAARKYNRIVQVGAQNRSNDYVNAAFEYIRSIDFGRFHYVRVLNSKVRPEIGTKPDEPVPEGVDYDMWLGPAPERPFNPNRFHYSWHWFWDYSGGDIINDGVHQMDIARWLIDRDYPKTVTAAGGIHAFKDDQETPDTHIVTYDYDGLTMCFEQVLWAPYMRKTPMDVRDTDQLPMWPFSGTRIEVYGADQVMFFSRHGGGWEAFDADGKSFEVHHGRFSPSNTAHIANFIDCIRSRDLPNGDIEPLHLSTLLCHYGNIAYRTGRRLHIDQKTEGFVNDDEANAYVKRSYREPWVIPNTI